MTPCESENENGRRTQLPGGGREGGQEAQRRQFSWTLLPTSLCALSPPGGDHEHEHEHERANPHANTLAGDTTQGPPCAVKPPSKPAAPHFLTTPSLPALLRRTRHGVLKQASTFAGEQRERPREWIPERPRSRAASADLGSCSKKPPGRRSFLMFPSSSLLFFPHAQTLDPGLLGAGGVFGECLIGSSRLGN